MSVNSFREDEEQKQSLKKDIILRLFKYLLSYRKQIVIVLFIMGGTIAISLINPLIMERAINVNIKNNDYKGLLIITGAAVVLNVFFIVGVKLRMYLMSKMSNDVLLQIREELYTHIQKLSFSFFDSRPTGKILARIIGDVDSLRDVLSDSVTTLIPDLLTVMAVIVIMALKNFKLALSALITLPFLIAGMYLIMSMSHVRWQKFRRKNSNLNAFTHESFSGIKIVQSFSAQKETQADFSILVNEHRDSFIDAVKVADSFGPLIELTWGMGGFLLYYIGINILGVNTISVGTFVAFSTYLGMFWRPIRNLSSFYNKLITNMSAAERVFEIMDTEPDITDEGDVIELPDVSGEVVFKNVTFSYSDERDATVLNDVSFKITPGETIALVGATGSGKTTIVSLMSRFYDTSRGDILIDGYNLKDVSINSLRRQMGVMTQDNFIFSGTVKDNIRYGKLDASDDEIEEAAKAVNAHEFIMKLDKGYDTEINERGGGLSIGQRQLLAFARTMVSKPRILILDEATSSIDTHTEILVQKGIEVLLKGRTSFVIAHRLSTIKKADRIFVIDEGKIRESGSHEELMALKGAYYELYQAQFKSLVVQM